MALLPTHKLLIHLVTSDLPFCSDYWTTVKEDHRHVHWLSANELRHIIDRKTSCNVCWECSFCPFQIEAKSTQTMEHGWLVRYKTHLRFYFFTTIWTYSSNYTGPILVERTLCIIVTREHMYLKTQHWELAYFHRLLARSHLHTVVLH